MADLAVGIKCTLLVYGLLYFAQIVKRFPHDLQELRTTRDRMDRAALMFHWAVAFIAFVLSATFLVPILKNLITGIRDYG